MRQATTQLTASSTGFFEADQLTVGLAQVQGSHPLRGGFAWQRRSGENAGCGLGPAVPSQSGRAWDGNPHSGNLFAE
jgi:hypothetical protein